MKACVRAFTVLSDLGQTATMLVVALLLNTEMLDTYEVL